jgi:hypothetical protein
MKKISPIFAMTIALIILTALTLVAPLAARPGKQPGMQEDGGRIVGRVIARDTGQPLAAELSLAMRSARGIALRHARASEQGVFELIGLPPADLQLHAKLDGYAVERQSLSLGEGEMRRLEFHLVKLVTVRGQLLDNTGAPVSGAAVRVREPHEAAPAAGAIGAAYQWETAQRHVIRSDARGHYSVAVHPEKPFALEVTHAKFHLLRQVMEPPARGSGSAETPLRLIPRQAQ